MAFHVAVYLPYTPYPVTRPNFTAVVALLYWWSSTAVAQPSVTARDKPITRTADSPQRQSRWRRPRSSRRRRSERRGRCIECRSSHRMSGEVLGCALISGDRGTRRQCRWTTQCVWNVGRPPSEVYYCANSEFDVLGRRQTSVCAKCVSVRDASSWTEHLDTWSTWDVLTTCGPRRCALMTRWTDAGWTTSHALAGSVSAADTGTHTNTHVQTGRQADLTLTYPSMDI